MKQTENPDSCSFCNKHKDAVIKLIVGEDVAICNECVELCETLLVDEPVAKPVDHVSLDPRLIQKHLDQYVIGQDRAKMVLAVAIANHYKRIRNPDKRCLIGRRICQGDNRERLRQRLATHLTQIRLLQCYLQPHYQRVEGLVFLTKILHCSS
jgi:ATP-dependent protease Clp ATPase subunit